MRYIAEQERKFIDKLAVKVYHSILPTIRSSREDSSCTITSIDNKIVLPESGKIYQQLAVPSTAVLIIILSGTLSYSGASGFTMLAKENDALLVEDKVSLNPSLIENLSADTDVEFIEIGILSAERKNRYTVSKYNKRFVKNVLNDYFSDEREKQGKTILAFKGIYDSGRNLAYAFNANTVQICLFVLKGTLEANGIDMAPRDSLILEDREDLMITFSSDTVFLLFIVDRTENR